MEYNDILNFVFEFNFIYSIFITFIVGVFVHSFILNVVPKFFKIPEFIEDLAKYGKLESGSSIKSFVAKFQVPKIWFKHFYIICVSLTTCSIYLFIHLHIFHKPVPWSFRKFMDILTVPNRKSAVDLFPASVVLVLYGIHTTKRFYESFFLSSFSKSKMNLFFYLIGHLHYFGCYLGLIAFLPGLSTQVPVNETPLLLVSTFVVTILGSWMTLFGSLFQYRALNTLAQYRNKPNESNHYFLPCGGLFEVVSCPHMFCEILVYFGLAIVMRFQHQTWNVICIWVFSNQVHIALMNHQWYKNHFKDYPLERKAIIPFIL